jgi:hypothetical protein
MKDNLFDGGLYTIEYTHGTDNGPRVVYCYGTDDNMSLCWDFTHDGHRKFQSCYISKCVEIMDNNICKAIPVGYFPTKEYVDVLRELYEKDGYKTFYDTNHTKDLIIYKPMPKIFCEDMKLGQVGKTSEYTPRYLLRTWLGFVDLKNPQTTWTRPPSWQVEIVGCEYKFSK